MRSRRASGVALVVLLLVGLWQAGHGVWIHAKAQLAQVLLWRAWTRTLAGEREVKPWPWADTWPVARLRVPAHGVDLIVLDGVSGRTLAFGPGHASGSPAPGAPGTAIISGHRDTHFRFLALLTPGDEILVETAGRPVARFRVVETSVVDARAAVIRAADGPALALLTCYPFDALRAGGPLRWVVTAVPTAGRQGGGGAGQSVSTRVTERRPEPSFGADNVLFFLTPGPWHRTCPGEPPCPLTRSGSTSATEGFS